MQNKFFPEIHNKFGFGCMRLPVDENKNVIMDKVCEMMICIWKEVLTILTPLTAICPNRVRSLSENA